MKLPPTITCLLLLAPCYVNAEQVSLDHLMDMSLEDLSMLDIEMDTASKSSKKLVDTPASVYVLTNERIQRSGARSIIEAIALVPGLTVNKFSETEWIVSARGFHDGLFNKLLVMIDGRSLYSPLYGGAYWSDIDYVLADIDRIEVLKGPGGTIWGGNALNGVVNIITKDAKDTLGTHLAVTAGKYNTNDVSIRHGIELGNDVYARAFYKQKNQASTLDNESQIWTSDSAGIVFSKSLNDSKWDFRFGGERSQYSLPWYIDDYSDPYAPTYDYSLLDVESYSVYAQFNYEQESQSGGLLKYSLWAEHSDDESKETPGKVTTVDLDTNYNFEYNADHKAIFGGGIRYIHLDLPQFDDEFTPPVIDMYGRYYSISQTDDFILNTFYQSELQASEKLSFTAGIKAEYFESNDSFELSPQLRALYQYSSEHRFWAGIGRAVAAPSYLDSHAYYISSNGQYVSVTQPLNDIENESVVTTELGYRFIPTDYFSMDSTLFYSDHDNVRGVDYLAPDESEYIEPIYVDIYQNNADYSAIAQGVEIAMALDVSSALRYNLSYSYIDLDASWDGGDASNGSSEPWFEMKQHLTSLQMLWNVTNSVQFDVITRYQDTEYNSIYKQIDPYFSLDIRLAWQANQQAPLFELIVQDINESGYADYWGEYANEEVVYLRASYDF